MAQSKDALELEEGVVLLVLLAEIEQHALAWNAIGQLSVEYIRACKSGIVRLARLARHNKRQQQGVATRSDDGNGNDNDEDGEGEGGWCAGAVADLTELVAMRQFSLIDSLFKTLEINSLKMRDVLDLFEEIAEKARDAFEISCVEALVPPSKISVRSSSSSSSAIKIHHLTEWLDHKTPSLLDQFQAILQIVDQFRCEFLHKRLLVRSLGRWATSFFASLDTHSSLESTIDDPERFLSEIIESWNSVSSSPLHMSRLLSFFEAD